MDKHHAKVSKDCQTGAEELLPSEMTVAQFDEMLSHMSPRQIRHAFKEMARHQSDDSLVPTEIHDPQKSRHDEQLNQQEFAAPVHNPSELPPPIPVPVPLSPSSAEYPAPPPSSAEYPVPSPSSAEYPIPTPSPAEYPPAPPPAPRFYGLNLGIIKLGVTDDGAINAGVNIGIARVDTKFGLENRVDAEAGVGDFNAHTGAGVGLGRNGVHADVYAGAKVFDAAHVDAGFAAAVGPRTGVDGRLSANAGPARFKLDTDHEVGVNGLYSGVDARVGIPRAVDFHTGAHVGVNKDSSAAADVGVDLGQSTLSTGAAIETRANTVLAPNVHIESRNGENHYRSSLGAQVGPALDARVGASYGQNVYNGYQRHNDSSTISLGVGQSGLGVRETTNYDQTHYRDWAAGAGPDYE